jgi:hypothetical protein
VEATVNLFLPEQARELNVIPSVEGDNNLCRYPKEERAR